MIELDITRHCLLLANNLSFGAEGNYATASFGGIRFTFKQKGNWVVIKEVKISDAVHINFDLSSINAIERWTQSYGSMIAALMHALKVPYAVCGKSAFYFNIAITKEKFPTHA